MAGRISRRFDLRDPEVPVACLFLLFAVAFNLYHLYPEVAIRVPELNDGVLHHLSFERAVTALADGQDPTDPWLGTMTLGYPLFHHYQHLAYLLPAMLYAPLRPLVEAVDFLNWTGYLLLSLFPVSIYLSVRRFGFSRLAAALGGLVASLLATDGLYGLEYGSYLWRGYGLYSQLWGMLLLPLALAQGYSALRTGRGLFGAVLLTAATTMAHLLFGYIALLSLGLWALLPVLGRRANPGQDDALGNGPQETRGGSGPRVRRLVLVAALVGLATAYFFVPFVRDRAAMNRSVWEEQGKYDAYGYEWTLGALVTGQLLDFGRFPALTLLAGAGLVACLWRWREERYRAPVALSLLWLLLYFGRPTWGVLLDLLPLSRDLHLHRLIAGVHLGGIILIGLGLALPWRWALARSRAWGLIAAALLTVALLYPVYRERGAYLGQNARMMEANRQTMAAEEESIAELVERLRGAPPGRVYAGRGGNWGKDYRVGDVPMYALLQSAGLDLLGNLYHALSLNADIQVLFDENRPEQYDLFNVRYVVAPAARTFPAFVRPVQDFGRHRLYEVATSGYFGLVDSGATLAGDKGDFYPAASYWLASDLPRVGEHPALLLGGEQGRAEADFALSQAQEGFPLGPLPLAPPRGRIVSETVASNSYGAAVEVMRGCLLMLKATYHPNWRAWVDGVEVGTVMLMPSYVGVQVSPGAHQVRLEYRPGLLRPCLLGAGLLVLALLAVAEWRREDLARGMARLDLEPVARWVRRRLRAVASWLPLRL